MTRKSKIPTESISRRKFIAQTSFAIGVGAVSGPYIVRGQNLNSKVSVAAIGAGGKGSSDTDNSAKCGAAIVALCDVDSRTLAQRKEKYPDAALFSDFRVMLDKMGNSIDAVTVSTPDHVHANAGLLAMKMGKHVYCQKPLTQSVYEARLMRKMAAENKVATQMGNQGSANDGLRRGVEVVHSGVIGDVRELYVWSNRPVWPQGIDRPEGSNPVPEYLDWDLWLGPAQFRPYVGPSGQNENRQRGGRRRRPRRGVYNPFNWRGWQDFGTGALGDMACHTVNMPFRALKMGYPTVVETEDHSGINKETYPKSSRLRFEFPERDGMPPLKFWWSDGGWLPHGDLTAKIGATMGSIPKSGCLLVGDKGQMFSPDDYGSRFYISLNDEKKFKGGDKHEAVAEVPETIWRSPGHNQEWFDMMKGGRASYSNFDIAAYLTEIILLGCISMRVGRKKMEWDGPNMKSPNCPEAEQFVKRNYRKGWEL
jgi:hypothetical protein